MRNVIYTVNYDGYNSIIIIISISFFFLLLQEYIKITVRNPRTHISREKALYTDYEVRVEVRTEHIFLMYLSIRLSGKAFDFR